MNTPDPITADPPHALPLVVGRHVEEAALLCVQRLFLVRAAHVRLHQLRRLDDRLAAHLDGLSVAGPAGAALAQRALADAGRGEIFAAVALSLERRDGRALDGLLAVAEALPQTQEAVVWALGWASAASLRGVTRDLLASASAFHRRLGLAACAMHRVDPGAFLPPALEDDDEALCMQALRSAGEGGRTDLLPACLARMRQGGVPTRYAAARAALLLGEHGPAAQVLGELVAGPALLGQPERSAALQLALRVLPARQAAPVLQAVRDSPGGLAEAVRAVGHLGDPHFAPWLIERMDDPALARAAGEGFSLLTGADLAALDLEGPQPQGFEGGPDDDPEDDAIDSDADDGLPWPAPARVHAWWQAHAAGFVPGGRYFMGAQPSAGHAARVLREAAQRQRIAAAEWLCLLRPGTPLFNTAAPAWRQQRWLDAMDGPA